LPWASDSAKRQNTWRFTSLSLSASASVSRSLASSKPLSSNAIPANWMSANARSGPLGIRGTVTVSSASARTLSPAVK
jgi:hypothetical protein